MVAFVTARRVAIVAVVLLMTLGAGAWGAGVLATLSLGGYTDPGSESAAVDAKVEAALGRNSPDVVVVYTPLAGDTLDTIGDRVTASVEQVDRSLLARPPVTYWSVPPVAQSALRSFDGHSALAVFTLNGDEGQRVRAFQTMKAGLAIDGVHTELGGFMPVIDAYNSEARASLIQAEMFAFPILLILLLLIFGSVVAAVIPLAIGGLSILGSLAVLRVLSQFTEVSIFATNIASLVGLGIAIDYSLFIVTRFREELASTPENTIDAVHRTMRTAGRTVAFSALLLVCGFVGMLLFPQAMIRSLGYGGMAAVACASMISLVGLPAALAILGSRINALAWRRGTIERDEERARKFWDGIAARVVRRPAAVAVVIGSLLLLIGAPIVNLSFKDLDHQGLPRASPVRITTDMLYDNFPIVSPGVTLVLQNMEGGTPTREEALQLATAVGAVEGVSAATYGGDGPNFSVVRAILTAPDRSGPALAAVDRVRKVELPPDTVLSVGGSTASTQDGLASMRTTIPWMLLIMIVATFAATTLAFRSIVLSIKAISMALISLAATFGVLTWIFEDGHGAGLIGITPSPLQATMSILIMAVVFGLSTDYEIFLLSRIVEAHDGGADTRTAVRMGAARTGRIVTAAALLLITATAAFSISELSMMRLLGIGIITGLVIDATVVRMLLVPALVALMGNANWWTPFRRPPVRQP